MPLVSALNGDNRNIQAGCPVAGKQSRLQLDRVILAGGSTLAAGIVKSGAVANGVINLFTDGIVDLDDWTLATGSKYLTVGAIYRLSSTKGKLTKTGSGQVIGLAASGTQLSLQISPSDASVISTVIASADAALNAEIAARIAADASINATLNTIQTQVTELQQPRYSTELLLAGM